MHKHNDGHLKIDSFGKDRARTYDQSNAHLTPINTNLYYLIEILFTQLHPQSKILCVGSGIGVEIVTLAKAFPTFRFVAVDPSESMLEICRDSLQNHGVADRCEFVHGYVHNVVDTEVFDAAICLLVLHHIQENERHFIITEIQKRLKSNACLITSELSIDFSANTTVDMMESWKALSRKAGTPEDKIQLLPEMMKKHLSIMPPLAVENLLQENGFKNPIQFFQSFLVRAWYARKD